MACSRCAAARQAAGRAIRSLSAGRLTQAAGEARSAAEHIAAKVAESDRIRSITRKGKPNG